MKALIISILIPITSFAAPEPTPSNAALRATVVHMQELAKDQQAQLEKEKSAHQQADATLEATSSTLATATQQLIALQKQIQSQTDKLNSTQDKLDKASKALWWYRLHWWGAWVMLGLGVIACGIFAFLKLTGRLALVGAAISTHIP